MSTESILQVRFRSPNGHSRGAGVQLLLEEFDVTQYCRSVVFTADVDGPNRVDLELIRVGFDVEFPAEVNVHVSHPPTGYELVRENLPSGAVRWYTKRLEA